MKKGFSIRQMLTAILILFFMISPGCIASEKGLVGYWNFDEGEGDIAEDSSGEENEGKLVNGPVWIKGVKGSALSFEGTDDHVEVPHSDSLDLGTEDQSYSILFWIKGTVLPEKFPDAHFIIKQGSPYPFTVVILNNGMLQLRTHKETKIPTVTSKSSIADGKWHFVACMRDAGKKKLIIYIDGIRDAKGNDKTEGDINNEEPVWIGKGFGDDFGCALDEVKIYDRLLSRKEIESQYKKLGGKIKKKKRGKKLSAKKAEGVPATRLRMQNWKPVLASDGKVECKKEGNAVKLKNEWMEVTVSKKTGEITSLISKEKEMLDKPAGVIIKDVVAKVEFGQDEGKVIDFKVTDDSPKTAGVTIKKEYEGDYTAIIKYTLDGQALCCEVELKTDLTEPRESNINFNIPALSRMTKVLWTREDAPFDLADPPIKKILYREFSITVAMVLPFLTVYNPSEDLGLSFVAPFDLPKPGMSFNLETEEKRLEVSNFYLRLAKGEPARAAVYIVPHEGCWRPSLAWMLKTYPEYFYPGTKDGIETPGWYYMGGSTEGLKQLKKLQRYGAKWFQIHNYFPFYGIYMPERKVWDVLVGLTDQGKGKLSEWEAEKAKGSYKNTYNKMRKAIALRQKYGMQAFMYFQHFELWDQYSRKYFPDDIARNRKGDPHGAWYSCSLMNPDPAFEWGKYIAAQIKRIPEEYPKLDGIFLDRDDYLNYDYAHDDGVTMIGKYPCYMLGFAQQQMNDVLTGMLRKNKMGIWTNGPTSVEVCKYIDGILSEFNAVAYGHQYLGLVRPMTLLPYYFDSKSYDKTPEQVEQKLKMALSKGFFPALTTGSLRSKRIDRKFRHIVALMKDRVWVLYPNALKLQEGMKGNIFKSPEGDYLVAVVDYNKSQVERDFPTSNVAVEIKVPDAAEIKYCYVVSGDYLGAGVIKFSRKGETIKAKIPFHVACSMVVFSKKPKFEVTRNSPPMFTGGQKNAISLNLHNPAASKKTGALKVSSKWFEKAETITLKPGEARTVSVEVDIPADISKKRIDVPFNVEWDGKRYEMSALIYSLLKVATRKIFIKSPSGEKAPVKIVNSSAGEIKVQIKAEIEGNKGSASAPASVILKPYEEKDVLVKITPYEESAKLKISLKSRTTLVESVIPVESVLALSKGDLFRDDFSSGDMENWNIIYGDWEVEDNIARGSGLRFQAITGDTDWENYVFQVTTKIDGSTDEAVNWLKSYVFFRVQDKNNYYRFGIHGDVELVDLWKNVNGKWEMLAIATFSAKKDTWYVFRVEAKGSRIKAYVDGEMLIKIKDGSLMDGGVGIGVTEDNMVTYYKDVIVKEIK